MKSGARVLFAGFILAASVAVLAPRAAAEEKKPVPPTAAETAAAQKSPQAKVYSDFLLAVQKEDFGALRKLFSKEQAKHLDDADAKKMVGMVKMMSATDIKVLKVAEKGDTADLTVSGKQDGKVVDGLVHMVRENGAWKVQQEEWKN